MPNASVSRNVKIYSPPELLYLGDDEQLPGRGPDDAGPAAGAARHQPRDPHARHVGRPPARLHLTGSAANRLIGEVVQSRRRPLHSVVVRGARHYV